MLSLINYAGCEGSDQCRKNTYSTNAGYVYILCLKCVHLYIPRESTNKKHINYYLNMIFKPRFNCTCFQISSVYHVVFRR